MLSWPPNVSLCLSMHMQVILSFHKDYTDMYMEHLEFKDIMEKVKARTNMKFIL